MKMTYLMMRLEWKVFISSKPCRLIVVPRQEFIKHMFGKLLFFFVFPKLGISYKVKKDTCCYGKCLCKNMKFILDSYFSIPYTIKKEMGFLPSKTLWFERVARFFFYVHNIIKIHFPVCIMPDQHRRMEHIDRKSVV